jgi:Arc/MetJ family transcription regulator
VVHRSRCRNGARATAHPRRPERRGALIPSARVGLVIFKRVGQGKPYPDHGLTSRGWASLPPRQVRLDDLVTTKDTLRLDALLDEDSTFYGDLFAHVVEWRGEYYLEDGLHRALRAALQQRGVLHARVHTVVE